MIDTNKSLILIRAYNEEVNIEEVIIRAQKCGYICVVNDSHTDSTAEILSKIKNIHVIHHEVNTHLPGAILSGMRFAVNEGYEFCIAMDAGLSHNPDEIPFFSFDDQSDFIIGHRTNKKNTPLPRKALSIGGNILYHIFVRFPRIFQGLEFLDLTSGFSRYSSKSMTLLLSKELQGKSYGFVLKV